ncbi:MAG: hypothetical protein WBH47_12875, partial [Streptosporangiaceae bacterium]
MSAGKGGTGRPGRSPQEDRLHATARPDISGGQQESRYSVRRGALGVTALVALAAAVLPGLAATAP